MQGFLGFGFFNGARFWHVQMIHSFFDPSDEAFPIVDGVPVSLRLGVDSTALRFRVLIVMQISKFLEASVSLVSSKLKPRCKTDRPELH